MGSAEPGGAGCVQGGCSSCMGSVPRCLLCPGRGAPHPLCLCSETLGPVRIQSAPLRKLDLRSPCEARFVPPRNFHCGYFWRPCRSVAAWVIQLLALLLAASGGSPRAWAPSRKSLQGMAVPAGPVLWVTLGRVSVTAGFPKLPGINGWLQVGAPKVQECGQGGICVPCSVSLPGAAGQVGSAPCYRSSLCPLRSLGHLVRAL